MKIMLSYDTYVNYFEILFLAWKCKVYAIYTQHNLINYINHQLFIGFNTCHYTTPTGNIMR